MSLPAQKTPPLPSISSAPTRVVARLGEGGDQRLVHRAGQRVLFFRPRQRDDENGAVALGFDESLMRSPRGSLRSRERRGARVNRMGEPGRGGRELLGEETGEADATALGRLARRGEARLGEADAAERETEQPEIGRRAGERRGEIGAERAAEIAARLLERVDRFAEPRRGRAEFRFARRRHRGDDRAHVGDLALQGCAARKRQLALDEVDRLDAVRSLVDRGDARIAEILRRARLFDEAHAAVDLHAERSDLVADVGRERLRDRRQQRGALARLGARFDAIGVGRQIDRHRRQMANAARRLDQSLHRRPACA